MSINHATQTILLERSLTCSMENSQRTCEAKATTLHTLANEMATRTTALENKQATVSCFNYFFFFQIDNIKMI